MPYTPPAQRSPASSVSTSPDVSRRSSFQSGPRPSLPRSASYLSKHRRTPSITTIHDVPSSSLTPQTTSDDLASLVHGPGAVPPDSVRQSPPPRTDRRGMPNGAIISPPDSASSGSDEESGSTGSRGRKLDKLQDLRKAASQIPQAGSSSPTVTLLDAAEIVSSPVTIIPGLVTSFSATGISDTLKPARKISHVRSVTEPDASAVKSADNSLTASEEDTDEDMRKKPQMVRKKSGELVRPALRPSSRRRPSSMPGTPVFSKAVHFDSHLEHVRHFLQVDRPLAVSAGSSPVDNYESESEFPFSGSGNTESRSTARSPPYEWEIVTANFPHENARRNTLPAKLEKVWLSQDQKSLLGSISVANLAYQKQVTCRFTLDYWKTTSEVMAEYSHEIRPRETQLGHDRFTFTIKLSDTTNLESKTLFFCIRYTVNGQEYWDNNSMANFQVDFKKKFLPQNGKNNFSGASSKPANGLPRSTRVHSPSITQRPKSMLAISSSNEFGSSDSSAKFNFDQPIHEYLGESGSTGLRLKTKSSNNLATDNLTSGLTSPSGVAFANRYDFGASLTAAVQAAKDSMTKDKDGLYMKSNVRGSGSPSLGATAAGLPASGGSPTGTGVSSPNPGLPSASYEELVNKYCFFGSKQSSPNLEDGTLRGGRFDGPGGVEAEKVGTNSSESRPTQEVRHDKPATGHTVTLVGTNPYFPQAVAGSSHVSSPVGGLSPALSLSQSSTPKSAPATLRPSSPVFLPLTQASHQPSFHIPQQMLQERFPWAGETHAPAAIRG